MKGPRTPREAAAQALEAGRLPPAAGERFAGYGVMGAPFEGGHYLALRHFHTSLGDPYLAVWHRNPAGVWTFYADAPAGLSCARYFGAATVEPGRRCTITTTWTGPYDLEVHIPEVLTWRMRLAGTPATTLMSAVASSLPEAAWRTPWFLRLMGVVARPVLRLGRIGLTGNAPSGQSYNAAPRRMWRIIESTATIDGVDLGQLGWKEAQDRLGDFFLPERGLFSIGSSVFEPYDAARHAPLPREVRIGD